MREIVFKGKTVSTKIWVEGNLFMNSGIPFIGKTWGDFFDIDFGMGFEEVIPETVGQFTGLHDKKGKKIFEGDILKRTIHCSYRNSGLAYDILFQVPEIEGMYGDRISQDDSNNSIDLWKTDFERIGNIHDNPELLEAK